MRVILWFFAVIGFLSTLMVVVVIVALANLRSHLPAIQAASTPTTVASTTVLTIDLERPITESSPQGFEAIFNDRTSSFQTMIAAVRRAAVDSRVKGLVARTGDAKLGLAEAEEFRDAVADFRAHGKFAFAFADSFGELDGGTRPYFIATAFDQIWLQPAGSLALTGVSTEIPFFRGALDKLGVTPEFERRGAFKTAATQFTDKQLQASDREAMTDLVGSIYGQLVDGIAKSRKIDAQKVKSLIDNGPYTSDQALSNGLVDHLGYRDEAEDTAKRRAGGGAQLMTESAYVNAAKGMWPSATQTGSTIGVIRAVGLIASGRNQESPFSSSGSVGADTMARAFEEATRDSSVKAIVFRIDSPGGSETASETIWRAVKQARQAGKPVIVSMSDEAASGGYYIAAAADKIVAEPMTLTGSIGVFGGKFVTQGLMDKLGVSFDSISQGQNAAFGSSVVPFTPDQQKRFASLIDVGYQTFLARVADGRHMDVTAVDAIAQGRVWTGIEAKDKGLVDALGGFEVAAKLAREAAHLSASEQARFTEFPRQRSPLELLLSTIQGQDPGVSTSATELAALAQKLHVLAPLFDTLDQPAATREAVMRPIEIAR